MRNRFQGNRKGRARKTCLITGWATENRRTREGLRTEKISGPIAARVWLIECLRVLPTGGLRIAQPGLRLLKNQDQQPQSPFPRDRRPGSSPHRRYRPILRSPLRKLLQKGQGRPPTYQGQQHLYPSSHIKKGPNTLIVRGLLPRGLRIRTGNRGHSSIVLLVKPDPPAIGAFSKGVRPRLAIVHLIGPGPREIVVFRIEDRLLPVVAMTVQGPMETGTFRIEDQPLPVVAMIGPDRMAPGLPVLVITPGQAAGRLRTDLPRIEGPQVPDRRRQAVFPAEDPVPGVLRFQRCPTRLRVWIKSRPQKNPEPDCSRLRPKVGLPSATKFVKMIWMIAAVG